MCSLKVLFFVQIKFYLSVEKFKTSFKNAHIILWVRNVVGEVEQGEIAITREHVYETAEFHLSGIWGIDLSTFNNTE